MSGAILLLRARTSLHPGAGTGIGAIDLPVQREKPTEWPMMQGSSVKGVMRDVARRAEATDPKVLKEADEHPDVVDVFGPPVDKAGDHAGALTITDARTLAFPVRSLKGVYALLTCPTALQRFADDCKMAGVACAGLPDEIPVVGCVNHEMLFFDHGDHQVAVVEDIAVELNDNPGESVATNLCAWLTNAGVPVGAHLLIVGNDTFSFCVKHRTQVITRNKLDYDTKTVEGGALFSQELLPPETIMYSVLLAELPRRQKSELSADGVIEEVNGWMNGEIVQFGGDETTGKGLCTCYVLKGGSSSAADS